MPKTEGLPRDATGKFLPRDESDKSIQEVLNDEGAKQADKEAQAKKSAEDQPAKDKEETPKKEPIDEETEQFLDDVVGVDRKKLVEERKAKEEKERLAKEEKRKAKLKKDRDEEEARESKSEIRKERPPLDEARIAAAAAEGVARALKGKEQGAGSQEPKKENKPTGPEARHLEVLDQMEKLWPEEYKNASKRYKEGQTRLAEYKARWEKEHPEEKFDEEAEEHEDFFKKHDLYEFWDERDYARAAGNLEAERLKTGEDEAKTREENKRLTELERKERYREARPQIIAEQVEMGREFWKALGEDFADVITGAGQVDRERLDELNKADPIGTAHRVAAARQLNPEIEAVYSLMNGLIEYDPKNPVHVEMGNFAQQLEEALAAKPDGEKLDGKDRLFLPYKEYMAISEADREKRYWTLSARDVAYKRAKVLAGQVAEQIKAEEEKLERFAAARGYSKPNSTDNEDESEEVEGEEEAEEIRPKPRSPTSSSESRLATRQSRPGKGEEKSNNPFFDSI